MRFPRASGILLHPTSLPGPFGIGDLGPEALRFADWLAAAGQKLWQVLPLGPTGYGDSPYQCFSAFAGNPLLISPEKLAGDGWLPAAALDSAPTFPSGEVAFGDVIRWKFELLRQAAVRFRAAASSTQREQFQAFCQRHSVLDTYARFMALKETNGGGVWTDWDPIIQPAPALVETHKFWQWIFFRQWEELKSRCGERGIKIMGDLPIYVAHDSADVWRHRELFHLAEDGRPAAVSGVPPDYFSATGQLWGNPIYRWDRLAETGYQWWIDRFRHALTLLDSVRLDHFRGFEAYWEVPAGASTAVNGRWIQGPGAPFFEALAAALGELPIVGENLGVITPEVEDLRERFGFPGMRILQFAFGTDPQGPSFRPHNYPRETVVYTGTHDNDTTVGWWSSQAGADSTRTEAEIRKERDFARAYLALRDGDSIEWAFIRAVIASVADTVIIPMQDVLGLGSEARMNLPGRPTGNWRWRLTSPPSAKLAERLKKLTQLYGR